MSDAPIGIFDSGVGGLTVARAVATLLPRESIIYIGDTAHTPYGDKPIADVRRYALAVLDDLVERGVKLLVIACNTASAAMLRDARERYDIPVGEVIQPAVRTAVSVTRNHRVGVTPRTPPSPAAPTTTPSPPRRTWSSPPRRLPTSSPSSSEA